jgi:Xaa-Pro aminopeptidase
MGRIVETRKRMDEKGLDLLIVFSDSWRSGNCRYLTGIRPYPALTRDYWGTGYAPVSLVVVPLKDDPSLFLSDILYKYAKLQIVGSLDATPWIEVSPWTKTRHVLKELAAKSRSIGFEGRDIVPWPVYEEFTRLGCSEMKDVEILEAQRRIKSEKEIRLMEAASNINDRICEELVRGIIRKGVTEKEIERKIAALGYSMDAEYVDASFMQSDAWGHARDVTLEDGSLLSLHVIIQYEGYNSDNDRVFGFGNIRKEEIELASITKQAFKNALKAMKPGIRGSEVFEAAKNTHRFIVDAEEAGEETHGHGIGLEGEELGPIDDWTFQKGMTFCVATTAHNKDIGANWFTEDVFVVTEDAARCLTKFDIDYIIR